MSIALLEKYLKHCVPTWKDNPGTVGYRDTQSIARSLSKMCKFMPNVRLTHARTHTRTRPPTHSKLANPCFPRALRIPAGGWPSLGIHRQVLSAGSEVGREGTTLADQTGH